MSQACSFFPQTDQLALHEELGGLLWRQGDSVAQFLKPTDMVSLDVCRIELVKQGLRQLPMMLIKTGTGSQSHRE
jgi:hypothetical protein